MKSYLKYFCLFICGLMLHQNLKGQSLILVKASPLLMIPDTLSAISRPVVADVDGDGDMDILIGDEEGRLTYYVNTADLETLADDLRNKQLPGAREWRYRRAQEVQPFDFTIDAEILFPTFVDIEADGDLDLFGVDRDGNFVYFENRGTAINPMFSPLQYNPFGLVANEEQLLFPSFADMDQDNDLDLMAGNEMGVLFYLENTGTTQIPNFSAPTPNPFGVDTTFSYAAPGLADMDSDGDIDLMIGQAGGHFIYYENSGDERFPDFQNPVIDPIEVDSINVNVLPSFTDLDKDGDLDMLVVDLNNVLYYYENVSLGSIEVDSENPAFLVSISPIPARAQLKIRTEEIIKSVEIRSLAGWPVKSFNQPDDEILLTDLQPDSYLIVFTNARDEKVIKRFKIAQE